MGRPARRQIHLSGEDRESEFMATLSRMMVTDELTQAHNKRYLLEQLNQELKRSARHGRPLTMALVDVERMGKLNDGYGRVAVDAALKELVSRLRAWSRRGEVVARVAGGQFAILMPETGASPSLTAALLAGIDGEPFTFEGTRIPVSVSLGVASWRPDVRTAEEMIRRAMDALYVSRRKALSEPTASAPEEPAAGPLGRGAGTVRRVLDAAILLQRVRDGDVPMTLAAWEIDEPTVNPQILASTHERWLQELVDVVSEAVGADALVGVWRERLVLAATLVTASEALDALLADVRARWTARPATADPAGARALRSVVVPLTELPTPESEVFDLLVRKIARPPSRPPSAVSGLPFPIAARATPAPSNTSRNSPVGWSPCSRRTRATPSRRRVGRWRITRAARRRRCDGSSTRPACTARSPACRGSAARRHPTRRALPRRLKGCSMACARCRAAAS